jgi:hypothetical protein
MKYAWIERNRRHWPISLACEVLGVSPSGYHERKAREIGDTSRPRRIACGAATSPTSPPTKVGCTWPW